MASEGEETGRVESYGGEEGLPGLIIKKGLVEVYTPAISDTAFDGVEDRGLEGFKTAMVLPLKDKAAFYGILYLKSRGRVSLTEEARRMLKIASLGIVSALRCSEVIQDNERIYNEMMEIQSRLVNAEKLMALGDMAATLAHDIRNPLISIGGLALRIKRHLVPDSPEMPYVEQMVHEIGRIEKLMNGMIRFLKDSDVELRLDDLNAIVNEALGLFDEEIAVNGINIVKDCQEEYLPVMADREQLKIAFDNLLANAIQSIEKGAGGGTITVSTGRSADAVYARIADSGGGIDPKYIAYIFNPFFTTKKHGTGLGLPITNSIVIRHRGVIEIENNAGVGVAFTVKLPCAEKASAEDPFLSGRPPEPRRFRDGA